MRPPNAHAFASGNHTDGQERAGQKMPVAGAYIGVKGLVAQVASLGRPRSPLAAVLSLGASDVPIGRWRVPLGRRATVLAGVLSLGSRRALPLAGRVAVSARTSCCRVRTSIS